MIRFFILFLYVWFWGIFVLALAAISDLVFGRGWIKFLKRLGMTLIWPLAVITSSGRERLFKVWN